MHLEPAEPDGGGKGIQLSGRAIGSLIGVAALVVFMAQNTDQVRLSFLVWGFTWPVWLLTAASALVGGLVWFGLGVRRRRRRRKARRGD